MINNSAKVSVHEGANAVDVENGSAADEANDTLTEMKSSVSTQRNRMSRLSMTFDRDGKGFLGKSERLARSLACETTGEIPPTAVVELVSKQRLMAKKVKLLTVMNIVNLLALVGLAIALGVVVSQGDKNTQSTITNSIHTQVASDPERGLNAVLTDKNGNTVSTVAEGHSVTATVYDDGNSTTCVRMNDLAQLVLNNENGIRNTVSIKTQDGDITKIVNLDGDAEIEDDKVIMATGKYQFIFDSPRCNARRRNRRLYNRRLFNEHLQDLRSGGLVGGGNRRRGLQPGSYTTTTTAATAAATTTTTTTGADDQGGDGDDQVEMQEQGFKNS